ncbi:MAG: hypothetical protein MUE88_08465 [Flavobacteriales bacterium]|jgi:hypothetical protein|nr:hypothetical protein [Flavobacteriales bacterium]
MAARYLITLTDPKQRKFFEELIGHLDFVKVEVPVDNPKRKWTKKEKEFMEGLRESIQEMKDDISGKKKLPSLKEVLHELRR